ncbi:MAG: MMPL family transporter [Chitinivibrionales bacterium]|nr:MMPL family transporter [Chitinivibrionales bacterium]
MKYKPRDIIAFLLRFRWGVIASVVAVTLVLGYFATKIHVDNDITKAVPGDLPEKVAYKKLNTLFSSPRNVLFLAEFSKMGLVEKIDSISSWAAGFDSIPGVKKVVHLGSVQVPVKGGFFGIKTRYIVPPKKEIRENILRKRIRENSEFTHSLISENESVFTMVFPLDPDADQDALMHAIINRAERLDKYPDVEIHLTGAPAHIYYIDSIMKNDFKILLPISLVLVFLLLYAVLRRLLYVGASLVIICISLVWTFGIMGLAGDPFTIVTSVIPVILFPIGVAGAIHVVKTFVRLSRNTGHDVGKALQETYSELMRPIFLSAVTTSAAFASFGFSENLWTKKFGIYTSIGVAFALLLTIILLPIFISFGRSPAGDAPGKHVSHKPENDIWKRYFDFLVVSNNWVFLLLVIIAVAATGFFRVKVEHNYIAMFPRDSEVRKSDELIAEHLGGTRFFSITLEHEGEKLTSKKEWKTIASIIDFLDKQEGVGAVSSLVPLINKVSMLVGKEQFSNAGLALLLGSKSLFSGSLQDYLNSWITPDRKITKIDLACKNIPGLEYSELAERIRNHINEKYPSWNVLVAGPAILNDSMIDILIHTQITSLIITFISVCIILCIIFRSVTTGLSATIPIILSTLFVYSLMGLFGVTINSVTVIIVNTCIGIGIDYSIHYVAGYRFIAQQRENRLDALLGTARNKGTVIIFNTFIVGVGFLVLAISSFPPIRHFGMFTFISMATSCAFALVFLPVFLRQFGNLVVKK